MKINIVFTLLLLSCSNLIFGAAMKKEGEQKIAQVHAEFFKTCNEGNLKAILGFFEEDMVNENLQDERGLSVLMILCRDLRNFLYLDQDMYLDVLDVLIKNGADVNLKDDNKRTALFYAAQIVHKKSLSEISMRIKVIKKLLLAGADPVYTGHVMVTENNNVVLKFAKTLMQNVIIEYIPKFKQALIDNKEAVEQIDIFLKKFALFRYETHAHLDSNWSEMKNFSIRLKLHAPYLIEASSDLIEEFDDLNEVYRKQCGSSCVIM